ncbi:hypothetical protein [Streptomyces yangpuensis]|uniref:hypothetical protein n=1 Tax=Streptomyces yangpuensis TaxID=1648182 RepID=UPI003659C7E2
MSADTRASWVPLTEGLTVPNDLDLSDRPAALEQLGVSGAANSRLVSIAKDCIGSERETALLVAPGPDPVASAAGRHGPRVQRLGSDPEWHPRMADRSNRCGGRAAARRSLAIGGLISATSTNPALRHANWPPN